MPSAPPIEFKRHYRRLSPKETDSVVDTVADLTVNFLKTRPGGVGPEPHTPPDMNGDGKRTPQTEGNG